MLSLIPLLGGFSLVVKKENTQEMITDDLTQVLEVINAEGDIGEIEEILEQNSNHQTNSKSSEKNRVTPQL